jgi:hypothetical protein
MKWLLLALALLLLAGVAAMVINAVGDARWIAGLLNARRARTWDRARPRPRCLQCRGTGWINREPERTFNFVGDGFEDRHTPATICPACGGTGMAPAR